MRFAHVWPALAGARHGYLRDVDLGEVRRHARALAPLDRALRVRFHDIERIPAEGGALLVGNHGPFGLDAAFVMKHVFEERGRVVRPLADRFVFKLPVYRVYCNSVGMLEGEPEQAVDVLQGGELVLVYPGGARETFKRPDQKYQVRPFWGRASGFARVALRAKVPIVPVACVGLDDLFVQVRTTEQMREGWFARGLNRMMQHDKYAPPLWLPAPRRVRFDYYVGEPIPTVGEATDEGVVASTRERVIVALEALLARGLAARAR